MSITTPRLFKKYERIAEAYAAALDGRNPDDVDFADLLTAIFRVVPNTSLVEVMTRSNGRRAD